MAELISLKEAPIEFKEELLKALNYNVVNGFIIDNKNEKVKDRYTKKYVKVNNMIIFPGSTILLDDNACSVNSYLEEFGEYVFQ